jgi:hypothetical protein
MAAFAMIAFRALGGTIPEVPETTEDETDG